MRKPVIKDRVERYLLQKLATGEWGAGYVLPSLRKASYELRVSHWPISLVWREAAKRGLIEKNSRGEAVVTQRGPELARAILGERADKAEGKRLAILLRDSFHLPLDPLMAPMQFQELQTLSTMATECGYRCSAINISMKDQLGQAAEIVRSYDAAIFMELTPQYLPFLTHLAENRLPTLLLRRKIAGIDVPSLQFDIASAAGRLVELLVGHGHRNITLITSHYASTITDAKFTSSYGWYEALEKAGILADCVMPVVTDLEPQEIMIEKLLKLRPRITALVVNTPSSLVAMASLPQFEGLRVPDDFSVAVVGPIGNFVFPPVFPAITHVDFDWSRVGRCAVEMIDKMIRGDKIPQSIRLPLRLNLTDSIGPAPDKS